MRAYTQDELNIILADHTKWLSDGSIGCRANLFKADLREKNLFNVNLREAYLRMAILCGVDLVETNFSEADLSWGDLRRTDLRDSNFSGATIIGTDFRGAYLGGANFRGALINGANFSEADLSGADFNGAFLNDEVITVAPIELTCLSTCGWTVTISDTRIKIGCKCYTTEEWKAFSDKAIKRMDAELALPFWNKWKNVILAAAEAHQLS